MLATYPDLLQGYATHVYAENNARRWKSYSHRAESGHIVVTVTHPSWANGRTPPAIRRPLSETLSMRAEAGRLTLFPARAMTTEAIAERRQARVFVHEIRAPADV